MLLAFVVIKCLNQTRSNVGVSVLIFNFYVIKERLWVQKGSIKSYIFRPDFSLLKPNPTIALNNLLTLFGFFFHFASARTLFVATLQFYFLLIYLL
jgi:hypothetical protein